MPRRKPKVDELRLHLQVIERLMLKYRKIGIFALPGEGKTTLILRLKEKYIDTEWHFYEMMENIAEEPYVYAFISTEMDDLPEFDIIYCLQYSQDYKESVSGITFTDGLWRPIEEYMKAAEYKRMGSLNLLGKYVKSMDALKKLLAGEEVNEL